MRTIRSRFRGGDRLNGGRATIDLKYFPNNYINISRSKIGVGGTTSAGSSCCYRTDSFASLRDLQSRLEPEQFALMEI